MTPSADRSTRSCPLVAWGATLLLLALPIQLQGQAPDSEGAVMVAAVALDAVQAEVKRGNPVVDGDVTVRPQLGPLREVSADHVRIEHARSFLEHVAARIGLRVDENPVRCEVPRRASTCTIEGAAITLLLMPPLVRGTEAEALVLATYQLVGEGWVVHETGYRVGLRRDGDKWVVHRVEVLHTS